MISRSIDGTIRFVKSDVNEGFSAKKVIKVLEDSYLSQKRTNAFTKKKTFSPSSIGYGNAVCPRYWYIAFSGAEFVESGDGLGMAIMANGTAAHSRIQSAFKEAGVMVDEELEITLSDPPVRGYLDVKLEIDGEVVIGEIKTTSDNIFSAKRVSKKPSVNHLLQILIYMKATGVKKGFILYENRNDLNVLCLEVDFTEANEAILEGALDWMRTVYKNWQDEKLPTRPYRHQNVKVCEKCPVNKVCWEELPEGEVKLPKMEIPTL